jgi:tetratricopeptide (TPR) repeat protein
MRALAASLAVSLAVAPAWAQPLDATAKRLSTLEAQALELERLVRPPAGPPQGDPETIERRLVQAQVAHGVGRHADAALLLYDIVEKYPSARSYPEALFFLADSLFHKGDNQLARGYFHKIVDEGRPSAPRYQQALERLIEISLRLQDPTRVQDYLAKLDALPAAKKSDSVPYVRGKYAYFSGAHDEALALFKTIPEASKYHFQGRYFAGTTHVAKGDLGEAAKVFHALIRVAPRNETDEEIVELAHLALGRLHYERDQPTDAIDHYLLIGRRSKFFDEALFEIAWVYVKAKEFDKALRALELLALANPRSARLPDVRILEGNLRIRKAQTTAVERGNAAEELARATNVFEDTRDTYEKPRTDLEKILAAQPEPRAFFNQIVGRAGPILEVQTELPEVVVAWLKEERDVSRVVGVATNLDEIRTSLDETTQLIARLERAVSSPSRVALFPLMAEQRGRAQEIGDAAFRARQDLAGEQRKLIDRHANAAEKTRVAELQRQRRALASRLAAMPGSGDTYLERVRKARAAYVETDKKAQQVEVQIISLEAQLVALDKYHADVSAQPGGKILPRDQYAPQLRELQGLIGELRRQLDAVRNDIVLASDEAGISDALAAEEREVRAQLEAAVAAEHAAMKPIVGRMSGGDRERAERASALVAQAEKVEGIAARVTAKIETYVDQQLEEAKTIIVEEKGNVLLYQQQLASYDGESVDLGGEIVGGSFEAVSRKFYEIGVRADVGLLDVSWAQKEEAEDSVDRLRQDFAQEKNTIESELRSIRPEAELPPAAAPAPAKEEPDED